MSSQSPCSINDVILGYWLHHEVIGVTSLLVPSYLDPVTFNIIVFLVLEVMYLSFKAAENYYIWLPPISAHAEM